jgi:polar amino acid transport system substrate-binding protein
VHNKKLPIAAVLSSLALVGLVPMGGAPPAWGSSVAPAAGAQVLTSPYPSLASCRTAVKGETYSKGVLTVATDDPVYTPWFVSNTPSNGKGYESAVAYDVGSLLGFSHKNVKWVSEAFGLCNAGPVEGRNVLHQLLRHDAIDRGAEDRPDR